MEHRGGLESSPAGGDPATPDPIPADELADITAIGDAMASEFDFHSMRAIADALPVMIAFCDADLRFQFVNEPLADWFELPRRDVLGKRIPDLMGEESFKQRKTALDKALAGERQVLTADYEHPTRGLLTTRAEYVPYKDTDGSVSGLVLVIQDITEQRAAERAARESEERFRRIADSAPVPIWVARKDGSREFINQAYRDFLGGTRDEARAIEWTERVHPDDEAQMRDAMVEGLKSGGAFQFTARAKGADGEYRWMEALVQPRHDGDGSTIGYIGVANDVTVAKLAEMDLRREVDEHRRDAQSSEHRLSAIFDTSLEMIGLMELDGSYLEVNRSAREGLGMTLEEFRGLKPWEIEPFAKHEESKLKLRDQVRRAASGEASSEELTIDTVRGSRTILVSMTPSLDDAGQPLFIVGEGRDITELKSAQDQLRQAQKMEALGQLTGGIAHDFNNLLTVVVGGLDIIAKRVEDDRLKRYADNALSAAERGARLTAQLLAFSRVQRLEVRPVTVGQLIEEIRPLLRNVLGPGINKKFDFADEGVTVMADPTQLETALLNVAINARDAMPEGGELTISSRRVRVTDDPELEDGDYVQLAIGDSGEGMSAETMERAFDPFFTTKEVGKGTGLGLSMVYGMARQSGGTARIDSTPGEGTCVRIFLREAGEAIEEPVGSSASSGSSRCAGEARTVLVIDDDAQVRAYIVDSLEEMGYRVVAAAGGAEGIEKARKFDPDVVVVDYIMPGLSGAEVAEKLSASHPDLPVLFVSGYSETDAIRKAAPDAPLIAKPFRPDALDAAICKLVGSAD